ASFFFQAEDGIRDATVTGVQTCALPILTDRFFPALRGIVDPEKKRSVIGRKFIELFEREAKTFGADHLVQGTIAPDWIESGGQRSEERRVGKEGRAGRGTEQ